MKRFDVIDARFEPLNRNDLKPRVAEFIGHRGLWQAVWMIEEEDGGSYIGQWAMSPYDFKAPFVWTPLCDLVICKEGGSDG